MVLDTLEIRNPSLRERLLAVDPGAEEADAGPPAAAGVAVDGTVLGAGELQPWLAEHGTAVLGVATVDTWALGTGSVAEVALAAADGAAAWFDPSQLDEADENAFAAWLADPDKPKVLHNAKGAMRVFAEHGWSVEGVSMDTALAAYLVKPGRRSFDLDALSLEYLGRELAPAATADGQLAFGADDGAEADALMVQARAILDLGEAFRERLKEVGAADLLQDVELPTSTLLARLERHGIAADKAHLEAMEQMFAGAVQQAVKEAHAAAGHEFNLGSPKQLQEVLFGELGLPKTKKTKTGYTTDADALAWLAAQTDNELPVIMLRHREQAKLRVTVEGLIKTIAADGRIHTTFHQTVAATGRLSSQDPNLQNIPVRTEEGRAIRRGFVVGEGFESLMTADYSQIELRVMAHLSEDEGLLEAFTSGEDLHTTVASQVFSVEGTAVDAEMRRKIKAMSYGLAYGLSAFGLSQQLNIDAGEARALMDTYFERFGGVRDYLRRAVDEARATGYTATLFGRRRYLPDLNSDNRQRREAAERMALNAPIQGTAADIVKIAMLNVDRALTEGRPQVPHAPPGPRRNRPGDRPGRAREGRGTRPPGDGGRGASPGAAGRLGGLRRGLGVGGALEPSGGAVFGCGVPRWGLARSFPAPLRTKAGATAPVLLSSGGGSPLLLRGAGNCATSPHRPALDKQRPIPVQPPEGPSPAWPPTRSPRRSAPQGCGHGSSHTTRTARAVRTTLPYRPRRRPRLRAPHPGPRRRGLRGQPQNPGGRHDETRPGRHRRLDRLDRPAAPPAGRHRPPRLLGRPHRHRHLPGPPRPRPGRPSWHRTSRRRCRAGTARSPWRCTTTQE